MFYPVFIDSYIIVVLVIVCQKVVIEVDNIPQVHYESCCLAHAVLLVLQMLWKLGV